MAQVNANPNDLRALADKTHRAAQDIQQAVASVTRALAQAQWEDTQRRKFEDQLRVLQQAASSFNRQAQESVPWLRRKAGELERFLNS
ncbi:type VII secretion system (Wss) protein ESAT-6 [Branchiibius hedensis]|uniref:Proteins of 100 residues with WXG n=1 Tax=Branchiibius hedensis TaxID=672460 RepID=A0A2Y8ZUV4_9MICO|nr:WXG100 family type VII secretion target [Branchiibius hedensis]PWJ27013.1 type VII secretion system (Wss) protein ESAT-6 [Branchiibius hedensis]SSA35824.1 Proteins of 100 residues with WXG [Branchiibius hedensis]